MVANVIYRGPVEREPETINLPVAAALNPGVAVKVASGKLAAAAVFTSTKKSSWEPLRQTPSNKAPFFCRLSTNVSRCELFSVVFSRDDRPFLEIIDQQSQQSRSGEHQQQ